MEIVNKSLYETFMFVTQNRLNDKKFAIISIQEPETNGSGILFTETASCKHVLTIKFSDIDPIFFYDHNEIFEEAIKTGKIILFSTEMAKEIKNFFDKIKDDIDLLIVHCSAGVSRSSAIAAVLNKYVNNTEDLFFEKSLPNMFIYNIMHKEIFGQYTKDLFRGNRKYILEDKTCIGCIYNAKCIDFKDTQTTECIHCHCNNETQCNRKNNNRCNNYKTESTEREDK